MYIKSKHLGIIAAFMCSVATTYAGMEIPRSVRTIQELDEARAEAREEGKALLFVFTDPGTSCGLCIGATKESFKELDRYAVPVLLDTSKDDFYEQISPMVGGALYAADMGNLIPKAVVTNADMDMVLGKMGYKSMSSSRNFSAVNKEVKASLEAMEAGEEITGKDVMPVWYTTKSKGRSVKGPIKSIEGQKLVIARDGKKNFKIPFGRLTPAAKEYLEAMNGSPASAAGEEVGNEAAAEVMHDWESAKGGKTIEGKFVSLSGGKITLDRSEGGLITFDVSKLSAESQAKAEELAGQE